MRLVRSRTADGTTVSISARHASGDDRVKADYEVELAVVQRQTFGAA